MTPRTGALLSVMGILLLVLAVVVTGSWLVAASSTGAFVILAWSAVHFGRRSR